jgi:hypothetical protein
MGNRRAGYTRKDFIERRLTMIFTRKRPAHIPVTQTMRLPA